MLDTLRKAAEMLSPGMRRRWLLLVPLAIVAGLAEMGAAAGIFAFVAYLSSGHAARADVVRMSLLLAAYYVAKTCLTVGVEYARVRVSHDASAELASGMLWRYLSAPGDCARSRSRSGPRRVRRGHVRARRRHRGWRDARDSMPFAASRRRLSSRTGSRPSAPAIGSSGYVTGASTPPARSTS
jgi:hypothetical protein